MRKRVPTHPGAILREDVLPSLPGMSVSAFARSLGVSRQTLHSVLAERSGVSAEVALRLGTLLGNGAQLWLDMQAQLLTFVGNTPTGSLGRNRIWAHAARHQNAFEKQQKISREGYLKEHQQLLL
mgnify:CR=1 FL=1